MLFVIDVGNTNIVMGVFDGDKLARHWRIRTERNTTEDEFQVLAAGLFGRSGITFKAIEKTVISCVVPPMVTILDAFGRKYLGHAPKWIDAKSYPGMPILIKNPNEVGADRIVNAVGAYQRYQTSLIVIDFGTATTFDAISERGEYIGGVISPGIGIASEALDADENPIPGLFAAGSTTGCWESESYCYRLTGHLVGFALNSGRIAGESAVKYLSK